MLIEKTVPEVKINEDSSTIPIQNNRKNKYEISSCKFYKEMSNVVYPTSIFLICLEIQEAINIAYINQTYKDVDMIKAMAVSYLYLNSFFFSILHGLLSVLDSLCSNAYASKKYRLIGIYMHQARIIGYSVATILIVIHYFAFEIFLTFLNLNQRVIDLSQEFVYWLFLYCLIDIYSVCGFRFLNVVGKGYVNGVVILFAMFFHPFWNYIFTTQLDLGIIGAAWSLIIGRIIICLLLILYQSIYNPCPESNFWINKECFIGLFKFLKIAIGSSLIFFIECGTMPIQALITISIGEDDYTVYIILYQISTIFFNFNLGFNLASTVMIAQHIVKSSIKICKRIVMYYILIGLLNIFVVISFVYFFKNEIFCLFIDTPKYVDKGLPCILIMCIILFLDNFVSVLTGILRGLLKFTSTLVCEILQFYVISPIVSYLLGKYLGWGVYGVWTGLMLGYLCCCGIYFLLFLSLDLDKIKQEIKNRLEENEREAFTTID